MALFSYKAVRPNGEVLEGEMEAEDELSLVRALQSDGLIPIKTGGAGRGGLLAGLQREVASKNDRKYRSIGFTADL